MDRAELALRLASALGSPSLCGARPPPGGALAEPTVVEARDPIEFLSAFARAAAGVGPVFLVDPGWGPGERAALAEAVSLELARAAPPEPSGGLGWLMIPTGGTSGKVKFARHDHETLSAAVQGFRGHFGVGRVNCVGVLPLHHVSGLMAWMRAAMTGGQYIAWDWKRLENGQFPRAAAAPADRSRPSLRDEGWYLSLVPTQLQRLLFRPEPARSVAVRWLRSFDAVFLGGGPSWSELADAAQDAGVPLALSYGMTETAAMAAAQLPGEFLAGQRSSGLPMPHVQVGITAEGLVRLKGDSVFRGYHPAMSEAREFTTEDLGSVDSQGRLRVHGRRDAVIITGGEKVDPAEVEAALWATGEFSDVAVVALPDSEWGQVVAACFPAGGREPDLGRVEAGLQAITAFKRPRKFFALSAWPRNAQGKLNRNELVRRLIAESGRLSRP